MGTVTRQTLRDEAAKLGLKTTGTRAELQARIDAANAKSNGGEPPQEQPVGVFVAKIRDAKGHLEPGLVPQGIEPEELPVLLERALIVARRELGLSG